MKRTVWLNKSNGQLCVTIPKNSGIVDGDIVSVEKEKIKTVVYSSVTGDLFHYGHLRILEKSNELGDFHICGVLTDDAIKAYKGKPIASFKERSSIISSLRCVDMIMPQKDLDPTENLKQLQDQFKDTKFIIVYGSNWDPVPGKKYIDKIAAAIVQPEYYEKLSQDHIIKKILRNQKQVSE